MTRRGVPAGPICSAARGVSGVLTRCKAGAIVARPCCRLRLDTCGVTLLCPMRLLWVFASCPVLNCVRTASEISARGCSSDHSSAEVCGAITRARAGAAPTSAGDVGGEGGAEASGASASGVSRLESSPSAWNLRSTHDVRRPRGLSAASAASFKRLHRPGRSLDTFVYSSHPYMSSTERRPTAAGVSRPRLGALCNPALEESSLARFWCSARLASTQPKAHASARCSPSHFVGIVLGLSSRVPDGAIGAAELRCIARELCASRRGSPGHPRLGAMGSVVVGSRWGCTTAAILPLHFSGDKKRTELAGCSSEGSNSLPPAELSPPRVSSRKGSSAYSESLARHLEVISTV
eukprot:scaffold36144_cov72-Phaeocystis_antarctica.AAC.3